jgi:PTS system galactitol-specific IIB component
MADDADLIVTTTPVSVDKDIPVIHTLAFLTGIGKEEIIEQIVENLQD